MDRRRSLLNSSERITHDALVKSVVEHQGQVFAKIRIADALTIANSGISSELYSYAFKAHFDFVVARGPSAEALFAVEFDGPTHKHNPTTTHNDQKKDKICSELGLPLLRIDATMLKKIGQRSIVGWLAHMWFMNEGWEQGCHDLLEEFDSSFWFKINPLLNKAVEELLEHGQTVVNGTVITGSTSLDHPELKKISKIEIDTDMDPFFPSRHYLSTHRDLLGYKYSITRSKDADGYWHGTTKVDFSNGRTLVGRGSCKPNAWPAIWHLPEDLSMHDAACQVRQLAHRMGKA